jgi:hypothetical protein
VLIEVKSTFSGSGSRKCGEKSGGGEDAFMFEQFVTFIMASLQSTKFTALMSM